MTYLAFKSAIAGELKRHRAGKTWNALRTDLKLPYDRPCPDWTRRMEREIGLVRDKGEGPRINLARGAELIIGFARDDGSCKLISYAHRYARPSRLLGL